MKRQLPLVDLKGEAFCVDVLNDRLHQQRNPDNRISFDVFVQHGDGYTFMYDLLKKNAAVDQDVIESKRYVRITLPALMELDSVGIALKYHIPLEVLCPELAMNMDDDDQDDFYEEELF